MIQRGQLRRKLAHTIFVALASLGVCGASAAQTGFTQVSAKVVDPNGFPYSNGTVTPTLVPSGLNPTVNGVPFSGTPGSTRLGLDGSFTVTLADNTLVSPSGTTWNFHVCGAIATVQWPIGTGSQCFDVPLTISGTTESISSNLNAAAPSLTNVCANSNLGSFSCNGAGGPSPPVNSVQIDNAGAFGGTQFYWGVLNLPHTEQFLGSTPGVTITYVPSGTDRFFYLSNSSNSAFAEIGVGSTGIPIAQVVTANEDTSLVSDGIQAQDTALGTNCNLSAISASLSCGAGTASTSAIYSNLSIELPQISAPTAPVSGQANIWVDSTSGLLSCELNSTASCLPGLLTSANCSSSASPAVCGAANFGSVVVAASASTVVVDTSAVTANSVIILTFDSSLGSKLGVTCNATEPALYGVSARSAGVSFTITSSSPITNPACFGFRIFG